MKPVKMRHCLSGEAGHDAQTATAMTTKSIKRNRFAWLVALTGFALGGVTQAANLKLEFWDQPRHGANCFNRIIAPDYFRSARAAGIEFLRLAPDKWLAQGRDFLIGNADDFTQLNAADLKKLRETLDQAHAAGVKVVLTMISLPGARWRQLNGGKNDDRLWREEKYLTQAEQFWTQLAAALKEHPAVVGYNPLNEPHPERGDGFMDFWSQDLRAWHERRRGSSFDPNRFNERLVAAIRREDAHTPIILDAAVYAAAPAFEILTPVNDAGVLYAFHLYEPYEFTNFKTNADRFKYPGVVEVGEDKRRIEWNAAELSRFVQPVRDWMERYRVPATRILVGEFGCDRRVPGAVEYLRDVTALFEAERWHWAFYAYREDEWDAMDYECGTKKLPWSYWKAVEAGQNPGFPHQPNPLWDVLQSHLRRP